MAADQVKSGEISSNISKSKLIYVTYSKFENDWKSFLHTHPFTELFLVTNGKGSFIVDEFEYPISKGDFIIVNANIEHTEKSQKDFPLEYIILGVKDFNFSFGGKMNHLHFNCLSEYNDLFFLINFMLREKQNGEEYSETICQNLLEVALVKLLRITKAKFDTMPSEKINAACIKLKNYIDRNYATKISIDDLAELTHLNKYYLIHSFNKYLGSSPINYLCQKRIEITKELLTNSDLSISEISQSAGFSSQSYFAQCFLKMTGLTPREYRNSIKKRVSK